MYLSLNNLQHWVKLIYRGDHFTLLTLRKDEKEMVKFDTKTIILNHVQSNICLHIFMI